MTEPDDAPTPGPVALAAQQDLDRLAVEGAQLPSAALAATALCMAAQLDDPRTSATSKSMCAARLVECLETIASLTPERTSDDSIDDLATRRAARRTGRATSANQ
jgi:hypothetical protein